jgi:hypothetical protein
LDQDSYRTRINRKRTHKQRGGKKWEYD